MKRLAVVAPPHIVRYRSIVKKKKDEQVRNTLQSIDTTIAQRYTDFENAIDTNTIIFLPEDAALQKIADELRSCYGTKTKGLDDIIELIQSAQPRQLLEKCPYCGITLPNTHDHYLPASKFPELAVHGLNLVPCCSTCNGKKGDRWKDGKQRLFIHFYSDVIPVSQYLFADLISTPNDTSLGAKFSIKRPSKVDVNDWAIIQNHYEKLHLIDRYSQFVNDEISTALGACVDHLSDGGNSSEQFINKMAVRLESIFGNNHWRAVLYKSLSTSQHFIKMVELKLAAENASPT